MAFLVGSTEPVLQRLAVPAVCLLIAFLAYASQWLFATAPDLAPGPLTKAEIYTFNSLVLCLWYTYYKACTVDPGRYVFPPDYIKKNKRKRKSTDGPGEEEEEEEEEELDPRRIQRWCRKCAAPKPPRAHHCKTCRRCIPKMDHHCPWTSNCVSLQTFPHFFRFLVYTNLSLWTLLAFLLRRFLALWETRHLPAYLGPSLSQLALLTVLAFTAGATSLALGLLLATTLKGWVFNTTMIESWEIERHESALERRYESASDDPYSPSWWGSGERAPGGDPDTLDPVEFPYDIGFFANMAAGMGTRNPLLWFFPFAGEPRVAPLGKDNNSNNNISNSGSGGGGGGGGNSNSENDIILMTGAGAGVGWTYEENGLNDREGMWPPPDPDKVRHARAWRARKREADRALADARFDRSANPEHEREAFRRRQARDLRRWRASRARILGELEEVPLDDYDDNGYYDDRDRDYDFVDEAYDGRFGPGRASATATAVAMVGGSDGGSSNKYGWANADGEHLGDYGVDEDAEFGDEPAVELELERSARRPSTGEELIPVEDEDVPLAELIRRRKVRTKDDEDT
ncbi:zf-DHHC-domain-containing protein [Daldinia caldariorum]|uniref:zf-DHHC-domain-containing protein n=1 Tax=Daldinia caldariorum TaxID=326644 RepID=UPI002007BC8E|nr:zf-DHHC-domain-containing protein [Daldinia caldariorum]KAI1464232.1 zf-DHHC-domain-containing protein [Daldinia caldariorum]